jgi:hypothetical protein
MGGKAGRERDTALDEAAAAAGACGTDMVPCESPTDSERAF